MNVKMNRAAKVAVTPAGPVVDLEKGQIVGEDHSLQFRGQLMAYGYADKVDEKKKPGRKKKG